VSKSRPHTPLKERTVTLFDLKDNPVRVDQHTESTKQQQKK